MIRYDFETKYELVASQVVVCEDTARCLISFPSWDNKNEIIDFVAKNNYITAGVYSTDTDLLKEMNFYLAGEMITILEDYNLIEKQFT